MKSGFRGFQSSYSGFEFGYPGVQTLSFKRIEPHFKSAKGGRDHRILLHEAADTNVQSFNKTVQRLDSPLQGSQNEAVVFKDAFD